MLERINEWYQQQMLLEPPDPTFFSSFIFLTNSLLAMHFDYTVYSFLFFCLFTTSIILRLCRSFISFFLDKLAIFLVVFYGAFLLYKKYKKLSLYYIILIVLTFGLTIFLYYYGYLTKTMCYDKDKEIGNHFHSFMHFIGSVGHHMIIFG
jgi:hypothetical protein